MIKELKLPTTYEAIKAELIGSGEEYVAKLMEFVKPVEEAEKVLAEIVAQMGKGAGKVVILYGVPGIGKSTFIESLTWRSHLSFSSLEQIDCHEISPLKLMDELLDKLVEICSRKKHSADTITAVAINYLENLDGQPEDKIRGFFRSLNGILRKNRLFILWPVTEEDDATKMLAYAENVSGTIFQPGREIVHFTGPTYDYYEHIAKNTIAVLNNGMTIEDFNLTDADLTKVKSNMMTNLTQPQTIRKYLEMVNEVWRGTTDYISQVIATIPKPTEIWFIFSYPEAEDVIGHFARRSDDVDSCWTAFHTKLWEYIPNSQRAADWTPKRLQLAIGGAFTTRIMYLPTNALVSAVAAFIDKKNLDLSSFISQERWFKRSAAVEAMSGTPIVRQLKRELTPPGKRKGGPAAEAKKTAKDAFIEIVKYATGSGNDRHINHALAEAIRQSLPSDYSAFSEKEHPWLPSITPDIRIDVPYGKHICIELYYTSRVEPYIVADYVLKKLDRYMRQLEHYVDKTSSGSLKIRHE